MESKWQRRRILIWGKTRPELSKTYREVVCTGGVFEDTKRLVRLYPIPLRYMDDEKIFKKYQWIDAFVSRATNDPRPESYKIQVEDVQVLGHIPSENGLWSERAKWVMQPENIFGSVEALQEKWRQDHTSLGLVKPRQVIDIQAVPVPSQEITEFQKRYDEALLQMELPLDPETGREIKPLRQADYRYKVAFRCEDERCESDHFFSVRDWEVDALYFRMRKLGYSQQTAADKVIEKLREICGDDKDTYFYVGNISTHPHKFTIVGLWWPKKGDQSKQMSLF